MDMQNRVGSKPGAGGVASGQNEAIARRERLRKLAMETIDLAKVRCCCFSPSLFAALASKQHGAAACGRGGVTWIVAAPCVHVHVVCACYASSVAPLCLTFGPLFRRPPP